MATGDLQGNLERVRMQLQSIQYPHTFDMYGLEQGLAAVILPLLHYALLGYSRHLARFLSENGYELFAKSDLRFMESTLKFLRQEFDYRSALTIAQMFSRGYAERKLLFIYDVIQMCKKKHKQLVHEKSTLEKVNWYATKPTTPKNPRAMPWEHRSAAVHSPPTKVESWEGSLRRSDVKAKRSLDALQARPDSTNRPESPKLEAGGHPSEVASKGSNMSTKASSSRSTKSLNYDASLTEGRPCASSQPSQSRASDNEDPKEHVLDHEELCQKIMDMAARLEARFSTLEEGVTRAKDTLQEKLVTLEDRVRHLENVLPCKEKGFDLNSTKELLQQHKHDDYAAICSRFKENMKNFSHAAYRIPGLQETLLNSRQTGETENPAVEEEPSAGIRDISNTHQNVRNLPVASSDNNINDCESLHPMFPKQPSSTQEFIAGIKARFNRTLELLNQEQFA